MGKGALPTDRNSKRPQRKTKKKSKSGKKAIATPPSIAPTRLRTVLRWLGWGFTFSFVLTVSAGVGATVALVAPLQLLPGAPKDGPVSFSDVFRRGFQYGISRPINLLVMGVDRNLEADDGSPEVFNSRSDTMLLVRLNPESNQVNILSIPRDTRVDIPDILDRKINAANLHGGAELATQVVSTTLNNVPIDRYIRISTDAFREIVDVVGGVEVFVSKPMVYEDQTQNLKIDLEPGLQTLNGDQAEGFVRYRNDELGDIGRTQRQQVLLKALQKRLANPLILTRLPQVLSVLQKHIDADLSLGEMLALMQFGLQLKPEQLRMVLLPGRFSGPSEYEYSYWLLNLASMDRVMQDYFEVSPPPGYELPKVDRFYEDLRIAVQNASHDPEGGARMVAYLNSLGFDHVHLETEDWPQTLSRTQIIPRWGDLDAAKHLQGMLNQSQLAVNSSGDLLSDLTIRVGRDWLDTRQAQAVELLPAQQLEPQPTPELQLLPAPELEPQPTQQ